MLPVLSQPPTQVRLNQQGFCSADVEKKSVKSLKFVFFFNISNFQSQRQWDHTYKIYTIYNILAIYSSRTLLRRCYRKGLFLFFLEPGEGGVAAGELGDG